MSGADRWKRNERAVAAELGGARIPNNGFGQPDVAHTHYAIQVKTVKSWPVWFAKKWEQTKRDAAAVGKTPLLALCLAPGAGIKTERLAVVPLEHYRELLELAEAGKRDVMAP